MNIIKKLAKYTLYLLIILLISSPFWIKNIPITYLSFLTGKSSIVDNFVCEYSIQVAGDSMSPVIEQGGSVELDRCFEDKDLTEGTVVLFGKDSNLHLGIIRHVLDLDPVIYKVSNERPNERLQDMIKEEIVAINNEIDTSKSTYQLGQDEKDFILDPNEYLSDLYLGRIPKGYGEEMAEVEKTNTFSRDSDKFCSVVIPKKELAFVDTEIVNSKTQSIVGSAKNIVFNVRPKPNTNCEDFGTAQGMLNLEAGNYRYRFLLNHQVLKDIPFKVE